MDHFAQLYGCTTNYMYMLLWMYFVCLAKRFFLEKRLCVNFMCFVCFV